MSSRPGRIVAEWNVGDGMDARDRAELAGEITTELRREIRRHAA
jgi:NitT/TauT family transport system ATP-binding protein